MKNQLFDTEEKKAAAKASFTNLIAQPGWGLLKQIVGANIEVITKQILDGEGNRDVIDRLRDKLKAYKEIIETPEKMLEDFNFEDPENPNPDPYPTLPPIVEEEEEKKE